MARQVISKCYCLPPVIVNWLSKMSRQQTKDQRRNVSASSILSDILLEVKKSQSPK